MSSSSDEAFFRAVTQSAKMLRRKKKMTRGTRRNTGTPKVANEQPKLQIVISSSDDELILNPTEKPQKSGQNTAEKTPKTAEKTPKTTKKTPIQGEIPVPRSPLKTRNFGKVA